MNQIICGDAIQEMRKVPDQSLQVIFCDWPFKVTRASWDQVGIDLVSFWFEAKRILKPGGVVLAKCIFPFTLEVANSNPEWLRYDWVWEKTNATGFLNSKRMPLRSHESILVFYNKKPVYNPQMTTGHKRKTTTRTHVTELYGNMTSTSYDSTERFPRSVLTFASDKQKKQFSINANAGRTVGILPVNVFQHR